MKHLQKLIRVRSVSIIDNQVVRIEFEDGITKVVDLLPLMNGPIFDELLNDTELFNQLIVGHGTLAWPNGADIDPDVLYYDLVPASLTEVG